MAYADACYVNTHPRRGVDVVDVIMVVLTIAETSPNEVAFLLERKEIELIFSASFFICVMQM